MIRTFGTELLGETQAWMIVPSPPWALTTPAEARTSEQNATTIAGVGRRKLIPRIACLLSPTRPHDPGPLNRANIPVRRPIHNHGRRLSPCPAALRQVP